MLHPLGFDHPDKISEEKHHENLYAISSSPSIYYRNPDKQKVYAWLSCHS
jgi:hypothetical protein